MLSHSLALAATDVRMGHSLTLAATGRDEDLPGAKNFYAANPTPARCVSSR